MAENRAEKQAKNALKINEKVNIIKVKMPTKIKKSFSVFIPIIFEYMKILFKI